VDLGIEESRAKAVIFDLDGVICNTEPLHVQSWQILFARKGIHVPESEIWGAVGFTDLKLLEKLFAEHRIDDNVYTWQIEKRNIFLNLLQQSVPAFPGAVELVKTLSWNWPLGIASSAWRISIETVTRRLGIRNHFQVIVAKEDVSAHKPSPEPFLTAAAELRLDPRECAAIEDSQAGIEAAKKAGMLCIAVTNSYPAEQLKAADLIVSSLEQAGPIFSLLAAPKR